MSSANVQGQGKTSLSVGAEKTACQPPPADDGIFDARIIEVLCDVCGHRFLETLGVLRLRSEVKCSGCSRPIEIGGELAETMAQSDAAWKRFQSDLHKAGR